MYGQITISEWLSTIAPKCDQCEYEICSRNIGMGLPMCHHPMIMTVHKHGRFTAHYTDDDHPAWCPITDPDRWACWMEERE